MEVREIKSQKELEEFLTRVKPHTFLNSWSWGEFEKNQGRKVWRLGIYAYDGATLVATATLSKTVARRGTFLVWHHSPVIDPLFDRKTETILALLRDESVEIGRTEGCHFLRASTPIRDTPEHRALFGKLGFRPSPIHLHSKLSSVLDLTKSEAELEKNLRKNTRYAIRKAKKDGVTVSKSTDIKDFEKFWAVYMETVQRQKFVPYSEKNLRTEFETFLENSEALMWFAEYQDVCISTAFIVYTKNSGFYHHGASTHRYPSISGSELVQWEAILEAKRRGCESYNFWGIVPENGEKHPWYGLSRFKRGFGGAEEAYVPTQDYVLSWRYWPNFLLEKYRKWKRGV